jgi:hypothetical protein
MSNQIFAGVLMRVSPRVSIGILFLCAVIALTVIIHFHSNTEPTSTVTNNIFDDKTPNQTIPVGVLNFGDGRYFYSAIQTANLKSVRIDLQGNFSDSEVIKVAMTTSFRITESGAADLSNIETVIKPYNASGEYRLSSDELSSLNRSGFNAMYISASTSLDHETSVIAKATVEI